MASQLSAVAARRTLQSALREQSEALPQVLANEKHVAPDGDIKASDRPRKRKRADRRFTESATSIVQTLSSAPTTDREPSVSETHESPVYLSSSAARLDGNSLANGGHETAGNEDRTLDLEEASPENVPLCSFASSHLRLLSAGKDCEVLLRGQDTLALVGQYDLWIRNGAISIYGAVLHASSRLYRVYAPSIHALPVIKALPNPYRAESQVTEVVVRSCGSRIRLLKNLSSRFGRVWSSSIPPMVNDSSQENARLCGSFRIIENSSDDVHKRNLWALNPPADWISKASRIPMMQPNGSPTIVIVCGPKASGKSTFGRMLLNSFLTRSEKQSQSKAGNVLSKESTPQVGEVVLLDLDPGQPEISPPGQISLAVIGSVLVGPPFTHPMLPPSKDNRLIKSHCVGGLSPKDDPFHYMQCALDLFNCYRTLIRDHSAYPLIVNCSGWVQGEGLEILVELVYKLHCTNVAFMSTSGPEDAMEQLSKACSKSGAQLHQLTSQPSPGNHRPALELRIMQTLSYFHLAEPEGGELRWSVLPLVEQPPIVAHFDGPKQSVFAVMILGDVQNPQLYDVILEGSVVDVVVIEDDAAIVDSPEPRDSPADDYESMHSSQHTARDDEENRDADEREEDEKNHDEVAEDSGPPSLLPPPHLRHMSIRRNQFNIPYLPSYGRTTRPLSPTHTFTLGQALIRAVSHETQSFHLLTPIPSSKLQEAHQSKRKIVLVRGKLDPPTWAYEESITFEKTRRRRREKWEKEELGLSRSAMDNEDDQPSNERQSEKAGDGAEAEADEDEVGDSDHDSDSKLAQAIQHDEIPWAEILGRKPVKPEWKEASQTIAAKPGAAAAEEDAVAVAVVDADNANKPERKSRGAKKRSGRRDLKFR